MGVGALRSSRSSTSSTARKRNAGGLQGAPLESGLGGDGLGGLAPQAGELTAEDGAGVFALLLAVEEGEVASHEVLQPAGAGAKALGVGAGVVEQGLGVGVVEQVHGGLRKVYRRQGSRGVSCRLG